MKYKKGLTSSIAVILIFSVFFSMALFSALLVQEGGEEYLISPTADIARDILANETVLPDSLGVDKVNELETAYGNISWPYDMSFLAVWISLGVLTFYSTFRANKDGVFSFFGNIFIGSLLLLLITTFLADFVAWFLSEILYTVFAGETLSLPIFTFYVNNLGVINFVWWLMLVLVSVIDRGFISKTGKVEE